MSVKVDLDQLTDALSDFAFAYLITVGDDYRAHTVAVKPVLAEGVFALDGSGNSTRRNAIAHPVVTLVWPPREPTGYTLIVDGQAEVADNGLRVTPQRAVLHRKTGPDSPTSTSGCADDCAPLGG